MSSVIKIKKGLNINLVGAADKIISTLPLPETFAIKPPDFTGVIPKLLTKEGDEVLAGTSLFFDKENEAIKFSSPVSGEIIEIVRGEKRKILEIKILADKEIRYLRFDKSDPGSLSRESILEILLSSGAWPLIRQRPYGIIPNPAVKPKAIFISGMDTNPLAPDLDFIMQNCETDFQAGLDALQILTEGKIHLNIKNTPGVSTVFSTAKGVTLNKISGPHPAGNVGVQIHHIDPVNKGEIVWCISPQDVLIIGKLFSQGKFDASRIMAITGSGVKAPKYYKSIIGTAIKQLLSDAGLKEGDNRIISGNVLSGKQILQGGYLGFYDTQITVIPEGKEPEFIGWLKPGFDKLSMSRAYFSWLMPKKIHDLNTNLHGEERPFVMSGQYEKVFPMDLYPVQLLKSIMVDDIEMMEKLGIYEVVEEDFALCEFVCTSKIESQHIIRNGLDIIRKELG